MKDGKVFWTFRKAVRNEAGAAPAAGLYLYGEISQRSSWNGDEVTPKAFLRELQQAVQGADSLEVHLNSGGGDVFAARGIAAMLKGCGRKTKCCIEGLCASAATLIACACDEVEAQAGSLYMIHPVKMAAAEPQTAEEMRKNAGIADRLNEGIVDTYVAKCRRPRDEVKGWMDAESWWTAEEAMENGFVDAVAGGPEAVVENRGGKLFVNRVEAGIAVSAAPKFVQDRAGRPERIANTPAETGKENEEMEITNVEELRAAYPALVSRVENDARQQAVAEERSRMQDIDGVAGLFGAELVNSAKYTEPCTAQELTYRAAVQAAQQGRSFAAQVQTDAQDGGVNGVQGDVPPTDGGHDTPQAQMDAGREAARLFMNRGNREAK